jgi:hypothetical protein
VWWRLLRFDEARKGEPTKKMKGVKRSFRDNTSASGLQNEKVGATMCCYVLSIGW